MTSSNNSNFDLNILLYILIGVLALLIILALILFLVKKFKRNETQKEALVTHSDDEFIKLLGGASNIKSYELKGESRLILCLNDPTLLKKEELKKFYISRVLEMSEKTILVGENLKPLENLLKKMKSE